MSGMEKMLLLLSGLLLFLAGMAIVGLRQAPRQEKNKPSLDQFSKWMVADIRPLLWVVTIGGFLLAFYAIHEDYTGALPWIGAMVGLPWAAHGVVCSSYLSMSKSDHRRGGITYEAAKAANFNTPQEPEGSVDSPAI